VSALNRPPANVAYAEAYPELWAHVEPESSRRLLLAALDAFAANGFNAATTRDIAQRAGMSPAAVYVHYSSKVDLLYEIARIGHEAVWAEVVAAIDPVSGPVERTRRFVEAFAAWHARFHTLARVTQYELGALPREHRHQLARLRRRFEELVDAQLEQGEREGTFEIVDRPGTVLAILSLGIDVARWYGTDRAPDPEGVGRLYGELVVRMLAKAS
jgi:AcrR family transcriptional regulator